MRHFYKNPICVGFALSLILSLLGLFVWKKTILNQQQSHTFSSYLLVGQAGTYARDFSVSTTYLEKALSYKPDIVELKRTLFLQYLITSNFSKAAKLAPDLLNDDKVRFWAHLMLALEKIHAHDYSSAETFLLETPSFAPLEQKLISILKAWITYETRGYEDGSKALIINGDSDWSQFLIQSQLFYMSAFSGKKKEADRAYEAVRKDVDYTNFIAYTHLALSRALAILHSNDPNRVSELAKNTPEIFQYLIFKKNPDLAQYKNFPNFMTGSNDAISDLFLTASDLLFQLNVTVTSYIYLNLALYLNPSNDPAILKIANVLETKDFLKAISFYDRIPKNSFYYLEACIGKAISLSKLGKNQEALFILDKIEKSHPSLSQISLLRAYIYKKINQLDRSLSILNEQINHDLSHQRKEWQTYYERALVQRDLKNFDFMKHDFQTALVLSSNQTDLLNDYALSLCDQNTDLNLALQLAKSANKLNPNNGAIMDTLGWVYFKLGNYTTALDCIEKALILLPQSAVIQSHLGDIYWKLHRNQEAVYQWNQALTKENDENIHASIREKLQQLK